MISASSDPSTTALCPGCFRERPRSRYCPHCGFDNTAERPGNALPPGAVLDGKYLIGRVLGRPGGFGITYLALDRHLETRVAIKEYLPRDLAMRANDAATIVAHSAEEQALLAYGLAQFLEEARVIARLDHPNVLRVRQFFEANASAYLVMDYYEGVTLAEHLGRQPGRRLPQAQALALLLPVLDGLRAVHAQGILHRDIKPGNVYLAQTDNGGVRPILLDFGAARQAVGERSRSMSVVLTEGYAPFEQYHRKGDQGPWTDIYAAAAVLYCMLTGDPPPAAPERVGDPRLAPPSDHGASRGVSDAVIAALAMDPAQRPQDVAGFQALLLTRGASEPAGGNASAGPHAADSRDCQPAPRHAAAARPALIGRAWLIAASVLLATLLAGGAGYLWLGGTAPDQPSPAEALAAASAAQQAEAERLRALREEMEAAATALRAQAEAAVREREAALRLAAEEAADKLAQAEQAAALRRAAEEERLAALAREREAEAARLRRLREQRAAEERASAALRPAATAPAAPDALTFIVLPNADGMTAVRSEPSARSNEVTRVYPGERATCSGVVHGQSLKYGDRWVRCSEPPGYVYATLLVPELDRQQPRRFVVRKTSDGFASVRSSPTISDGRRIAKLSAGTVVHCDRLVQGERLRSGEHWLRCPDVDGYIHASLLIADWDG
jgi:serine/threonine protein kinase